MLCSRSENQIRMFDVNQPNKPLLGFTVQNTGTLFNQHKSDLTIAKRNNIKQKLN